MSCSQGMNNSTHVGQGEMPYSTQKRPAYCQVLIKTRVGLVQYLRAEVGLSGLRAVELQALPDALPEHVQGRVGLHDLGHGLRDEGLHPREPVPKGAVQVVRQVNANHHTCTNSEHRE